MTPAAGAPRFGKERDSSEGGDGYETENKCGKKCVYPMDQPDFLGNAGCMAGMVSMAVSKAASRNAAAFWI